jgi:hypothetical protein
MKIKINARLKPRPFFEIRYIKSNFGGSIPLIGISANNCGIYLCLWPLYLSLTISRKLKPSPLTEEEKENLRQDDL